MGQQSLHSRHPLRHLHKDEEVAAAIMNLFDAITRNERRGDGSREHLVIILPTYPDGIPVCGMHGGPIAPIKALEIAKDCPHAFETDNYVVRYAHGKS